MSRKDPRKSFLLRLPPDMVEALRHDPGRRQGGSLADSARRRVSRQLEAGPPRHWPDQPANGRRLPIQLPRDDLRRIHEIAADQNRSPSDVIYALLSANLTQPGPP